MKKIFFTCLIIFSLNLFFNQPAHAAGGIVSFFKAIANLLKGSGDNIVNSADDLIIGKGSTVGTTPAIVIDSNENVGIGRTPATNNKLDLEIDTDKRLTFQGNISEIGNVAGFQSANSAGSALAGFGIRADTIRLATGSSERVRIDSSGNLGLGTSSPQRAFHVNGGAGDTAIRLSNSASGSGSSDGFDITMENPNPEVTIRNRESYPIKFVVSTTEVMRITNTGNLGVGDTSPAYRIELPNTASAAGQGRANNWVTYSDSRIKSNIQVLDYGLDIVKQLKPSKYKHHNSTKDDDGQFIKSDEGANDIGFIAQEVLPLMPEVVGIPEDTDKDLYSINYPKLTAVLTKAIQEQQEQIEALQSEINTLKGGE